jgi:hypothetical protein
MTAERLRYAPIAFLRLTLDIMLIGSVALGCSRGDGEAAGSSRAPCGSSAHAPTLEDALSAPDPAFRGQLLGEALGALGANGDETTRAFLREHHALLDDASLALIMRWRTDIDPEWTFARARRFSRARRVPATSAVLERWAERDPQSAARAYDAIAIKQRVDGGALAIARGWETSGRPGLDGFIAERESSQKRTLMLREVLARIEHRSGPDALIDWATSIDRDLPNGMRLATHRTAASAIARTEPAKAIAWIDRVREIALDAHLVPAMSRAVVVRWAANDSDAAMAWAAKLDAGPERDRTIHEAYRAMSNRDAASAARWFESQPYADWLEPALAFRLGALAHDDGALAITRIDQIRDPDRRHKTVVAVLGQWRKQDPEAANAWLAQSNLPEATRRDLTPRKRRSQVRAPHDAGHTQP